jgi:hypothetical protein
VFRLGDLAHGVTVPAAAAACAAVLAASPFLPWFATDIGPPFAPESTSGWEATGVARIVLGLAALALAANLLLAFEAAGRIILDARGALGLAGIAAAAGALALVLVGYRLLVLPEPAEFLARDIGLYVALGAAAGATALSVAQLPPRVATAPSR